MTPETIITLIQRALEVLMLLAGPILLTVLACGLLVSIFQAATQINESTLSFIPKLLAAFTVFVLAGPWMIGIITDYTTRLFQSIPQLLG